ncbi:MAG: porin family protein [Aliivibrio sp.]|uniref:outer membrane beta-barrel protein n=1 Tax=Aliivibrio sp. TaxID=1872443 RepID=UPI001A496078|nr:porin family protein [Aliivibrio sp.]
MKRLLLISAILISPLSHANDYNGFYLGAGIGTVDIDDDGALDDISPALNTSYSGNTYKLISGYKFNRIVAVEGQYTSYGDMKISASGSNTNLTFEQRSVTISANVGYTFNNGLRPFGILGVGRLDSKSDGDSDHETTLRIGSGIEYTPPKLENVSFRLAYEWDMYRTEEDSTTKKEYDQSVGSFYFSTLYNF